MAIFQTWIKPNASPLSELPIQPLSCQWQWCTVRVNNLTMNLCTWIKYTWNKTFYLHHLCSEFELLLTASNRKLVILAGRKRLQVCCVDAELMAKRCFWLCLLIVVSPCVWLLIIKQNLPVLSHLVFLFQESHVFWEVNNKRHIWNDEKDKTKQKKTSWS